MCGDVEVERHAFSATVLLQNPRIKPPLPIGQVSVWAPGPVSVLLTTQNSRTSVGNRTLDPVVVQSQRSYCSDWMQKCRPHWMYLDAEMFQKYKSHVSFLGARRKTRGVQQYWGPAILRRRHPTRFIRHGGLAPEICAPLFLTMEINFTIVMIIMIIIVITQAYDRSVASFRAILYRIRLKVKVNFTLGQATKAQKVRRVIALLIL